MENIFRHSSGFGGLKFYTFDFCFRFGYKYSIIFT